ncbi:MAG: four helix bundle protein [Planctomycetes bacterium]|nr:four helix bundle protein [Planctomycetota bacterium]
MANGQKAERGPIRRFEDLEVWQLARELVRGVYRAAQSQGLRRDLTLSSQMKRAAVSICSNIAEGYERGTRKQYIEFIYVAKGSAGELRCQVILAHDVGMLDTKAYDWLLERCESCSRMLAGYLKHLKATSGKFRGTKFDEGNSDKPNK